MILTAAFALVGALFGAFLAKRRGGKGLDLAQYAGSCAMAFGIVGLFLTIFLVS